MITLTLTEAELQSLAGLMDMGCKAGGLSVVKQAASLLTKLEAAVAAANAPKSNVTPDFKGVSLNAEPQETE